MFMTNNEMGRLERKRDRYYRMADADQEYARQLFNSGKIEFAEPLEAAYQRYGAALEIDRTLKSCGYKRKPKFLEKYSDKEIRLIVKGMKQKLVGIATIIFGILTVIPEKDITAASLLVSFGLYMIFTKEYIIS